mmetsp:Transcript_1057/g.1596  ORF Transcript_1057/g.1596 Transcript_1057/m.1596 type:complete len:145 (+) Transcript_1057:61-495(+)
MHCLAMLFASCFTLSRTSFGLVVRGLKCRISTSSFLSSNKYDWIDEDLIRKTSNLAQMETAEDEIEQLTDRFRSFIGFVEAMDETTKANEVNEAAVEMKDYFGESSFLRDDEPIVFDEQGIIKGNMPETENDFLKVPKVGEEGS